MARRWGVTPEGLRSKARIKTLTVPRQIAMFLARELLQMQLVEIGQAFGGRDHSTVIHSVDKVQTQLGRDRQFRERVESARAELLTVVVHSVRGAIVEDVGECGNGVGNRRASSPSLHDDSTRDAAAARDALAAGYGRSSTFPAPLLLLRES